MLEWTHFDHVVLNLGSLYISTHYILLMRQNAFNMLLCHFQCTK